jgi:hypothetical protein
MRSLGLEVLKDVHELLKSSGVGGFREAAFSDAVFRRNVFSCKVILSLRFPLAWSSGISFMASSAGCMSSKKGTELDRLSQGLSVRGMYNLL